MDLEDFHEVFNHGNDFVERMYEIIQIPFWRDVLDCLKLLFKSDVCNNINTICATSLWYNSMLRLPLKHKWFKKGVSIIGDILTDDCNILPLEAFQEKFDIKTNFLEYGGFALTLKLFMDRHEKTNSNLLRPTNSLIYSVILRDSSGVSNLYAAI